MRPVFGRFRPPFFGPIHERPLFFPGTIRLLIKEAIERFGERWRDCEFLVYRSGHFPTTKFAASISASCPGAPYHTRLGTLPTCIIVLLCGSFVWLNCQP